MYNDLPLHFSTMKPTLPTVCRRYEIRAPMFHLPMIRHTFAEHSIRYCLKPLKQGYAFYLNNGKGGYRFIKHEADIAYSHGRPQEFFQGGGKPLGGAQKKSVKGAPIFF